MNKIWPINKVLIILARNLKNQNAKNIYVGIKFFGIVCGKNSKTILHINRILNGIILPTMFAKLMFKTMNETIYYCVMSCGCKDYIIFECLFVF